MREERDDERGLRRLSAVDQRRDLLAATLVAGSVLALVAMRHGLPSLGPRPSEGACAALVDRYLWLASRQRYPELDEATIAAAARSPAAVAKKPDDVEACRERLSESQVACGLDAADVDALERCIQ